MVAGVDCFLPAIYGWISMSLLEALEIHFLFDFIIWQELVCLCVVFSIFVEDRMRLGIAKLENKFSVCLTARLSLSL